jgi:hypothetical protein
MNKALCLAFLCWLGLCSVGCDEGGKGDGAQKSRTTLGVFSGVDIRTIEHDKHLFVVGYTGSTEGGLSILHHPACPCGTLKPEK